MIAIIATVLHILILTACFFAFYGMGKRHGQRLEIRTMIELLDALKVDGYEQVAFRDRFKGALQWSLDGKRKGERDA